MIEMSFVEHDERFVSAFLRLDLKEPPEETRVARLRFAIEGIFQSTVDLEDIEEEIWQDFKDVSAATLLWPYARELADNFARRMRLDFALLPTLNRLSMATDQEAAEAKAVCEKNSDSEYNIRH
jgi:preprotein translocase subunit SecB